MTTVLDQIAVILSASALLLCVVYIGAYRPILLVCSLFILFTLVWRTASTAFIDIAGPVWSSQTLRTVGPGLATPPHVLAYFVTLAPFLIIFRPVTIAAWISGADRRPARRGMLTLSDITVALSSLFLAYLCFDMVRRGTIPFFVHIERFVYTARHAGAAHQWLVKYGNFLVFWWGVMFAAEWLRNRRTDIRYLVLLGIIFAYMFLAGNRFSIFYSFSCFFIIPLAGPVALEIAGSRSRIPFFWMSRIFTTRSLVVFSAGAALLATIAGVAIFNNLVSVRGYHGKEVESQFLERLLVQPSELGWISYERIFDFGRWQPDSAYDFLFHAPIDPDKNTTPQYLMLETIGEPRTSEHILGGFQFAGGFPEIFFELFGPIYAWLFIFGCGYIAASLTALIVKGTLQGAYASAFLALYVLYGFYVMYVGGMLNFVTVASYWVKIAALMFALIMEVNLGRTGLPLVPWAIIGVPRFDWLAAIGVSFRQRLIAKLRTRLLEMS